jgi:glycosyltransferase involved in cell wall biosynthesis
LKDKKVLIISYYWPPAGGPGVQRWLKFVKYLPDFGYKPFVYIPENPTYPLLDSALLDESGPEVVIVKQKIFEPYRAASVLSGKKTKSISSGIIPAARKQTLLEKALLWLRGNVFIPDARIFWVRPSVNFLTDFIRDNNIAKVITTGPPHSLHLIGMKLRRKLDITWVADFRDPWTTIGYHKELKLSKYAAAKHVKLERQVLLEADQIIVTSKTTKAEFQALTDRPIEVITNGYDYEEVIALPKDSEFTLSHIGSLLSERNPEVLWQVLSEIIAEHSDFAADFRLKLAGAVSASVLESLETYGLNEHLIQLGYISHKEAVAQQRCSQLLLLIEIDSPDTRSIIPGKLFEYMSAGRPIVALGPEGSDIEGILKETNSGYFLRYNEKALLKQHILSAYTKYKNGTLEVQAVGLQQYSRKKLTHKLADLLDRLRNA